MTSGEWWLLLVFTNNMTSGNSGFLVFTT
jgi:hypothetical protein